MDKLKQMLEQLQEKINALSLRERAILFLAISFALYTAVDYLLLAPLDLQQQKQLKEIHSIQAENSQLEAQALDIINRYRDDPNQAERQQLATLHKQIEAANTQIEDAVEGLIPPERMALALENLLHKQQGLKFVSIDSLPAEPILQPTTADEAGSQFTSEEEDDLVNSIYRHSFKIRFEGSYLETLAYLRELEALDWSFRWDQIEMTMLEYPTASITLMIHTISLDEELIGV